MEAREIEAGTQILIGAPARPMPSAQAAAIAAVLAKVPGVVEAHLPQVYAPGAIDEPAQVLVVVLRPGADADATLDAINCDLARLLTEDSRLDIFPVAGDSGMLRDVRAVGCQILGGKRDARPWWKFWGG
ncbi:MAG: enhanced serine sensitivity protein SseB C-terminal domain-containing protein [Acidobacteria bacterium]|nr:enhanced serine sensitivity protein SseB C-terminal domain-containing protein [Acidobacteriota bacterium]MCA1642795.1 enhanced serine sensitivity protein SseB C-terminal domain-containing protein [Acidobacteriota bacterium]